MSSWSVRVEVVTLYTMEVEADTEAEALAISENAGPHMLAKEYDEDDCTVTPLSAECNDEDDDDGECPSCGGSGGGEDRALRCGSCGGSGSAGRDDDDREPDEPEPREYADSWEPE